MPVMAFFVATIWRDTLSSQKKAVTDTLTPEQRSRVMRRIRGCNTKPEMIVRRFLYANGFRYRVNVKNLPGKPDIVLRKYATAIFIHGCFWHGHSCKLFKLPQTNQDFWSTKIARNQERDSRVREQLSEMGWNTMVVWECQLKPNVRQQTLDDIADLLCKAYLDRHRIIKSYTSEEEPMPMVAEPETKYV